MGIDGEGGYGGAEAFRKGVLANSLTLGGEEDAAVGQVTIDFHIAQHADWHAEHIPPLPLQVDGKRGSLVSQSRPHAETPLERMDGWRSLGLVETEGATFDAGSFCSPKGSLSSLRSFLARLVATGPPFLQGDGAPNDGNGSGLYPRHGRTLVLRQEKRFV